MATSKSKTNRYLTIILVLILCVVSFLTYEIVSSYQKIKNDVIEAESELEIVNSELNDISLITNQLNEEYNDYLNIDNKIIDIKKIFFENASKADSMARNNEANFKVCYLTFDDGPYLLTDTFLDILEEKDVLATFFVLKKTNEMYDSIYKREKMNGHTIGNHTASHQISKGIYRSNEIFVQDLLENRQFIYEKLGIYTDVMRFPGGTGQPRYMGLNASELYKMVTNEGYGYVGWNYSTGDGGAVLSPDEYLHNVIDYTANGKAIVILMHDYSTNTALCLPELIDNLKAQGYIFLPLWHDCPSVSKAY